MLHTDRLTFALLLCRIHLKGKPSEPNLDQEFNFFLRGKEGVFSSSNIGHIVDGLTSEQQEAVTRLVLRLAPFTFFKKHFLLVSCGVSMRYNNS